VCKKNENSGEKKKTPVGRAAEKERTDAKKEDEDATPEKRNSTIRKGGSVNNHKSSYRTGAGVKTIRESQKGATKENEGFRAENIRGKQMPTCPKVTPSRTAKSLTIRH